MLKRIAAFLMVSCQASQVPEAAGTDVPRTGTTQTVFPSETPEVIPSSTSTLRGEAEPLPTDRPTAATAPRCFTYSEVAPFAFMLDGLRILIRDRSAVRIFNLERMEAENFLQAPQELAAAALSPDGEALAWSLADNTIQLIRIADGKLLNTMKGHTLPVYKLRFSAKGDRLFSASYDTWVRIWDRNGELLDAFQPTANDLPNDIEGIGISPDGTKLGTIPFDGPAKIWDLATKKEIVNLGGTGGDVVSDIAFSPDGRFVAADQLERLSLWRTSDWKIEWTGTSSVAFAFSPDGRFLAYSDADDRYNVFLRSLTPKGTEETHLLEGDQAMVWDIFFSPDGKLLAAVGGEVRIWHIDSGEL
jgi:WD40 repeat protein